jgi:tetratricopeptide repeat protein
MNLARIYAIEGSTDKAAGVLLELLKQHPDYPPVRQALDQWQR